MRNISTSSHAEHLWSYSQSKWVLTRRQRKQLQMEKPNVQKTFGFMNFFTYNLRPQWYIGLLFVIYAPAFIKAPLKPWYVREVWPFFYEYFWLLTPKNFKFLQILSLWKTNNTNAWIFVCLFVCFFVLFCKYDMRHESTPTSDITHQWNISMNKTEAKAFSELKAQPRQKEKWWKSKSIFVWEKY